MFWLSNHLFYPLFLQFHFIVMPCTCNDTVMFNYHNNKTLFLFHGPLSRWPAISSALSQRGSHLPLLHKLCVLRLVFLFEMFYQVASIVCTGFRASSRYYNFSRAYLAFCLAFVVFLNPKVVPYRRRLSFSPFIEEVLRRHLWAGRVTAINNMLATC